MLAVLSQLGCEAVATRLSVSVLPGLEELLVPLTASGDEWLALLKRVYEPRSAGPQELFSNKAEQLRQDLISGALSIILELGSTLELRGSPSAYVGAAVPSARERVLLNADWVAIASDIEIQRVLLEELCRVFDQRLTGSADSSKDQVELFAVLVQGLALPPATLDPLTQQPDNVPLGQFSLTVGWGTSEASAPLADALQRASRLLSERAVQADFADLLRQVFARNSTPTEAFEQQLFLLHQALASGSGLDLCVELRSAGEMAGLIAAYAAIGHTGTERIYFNSEWALETGSPDLLELVALEELGHALDRRLNGGNDSSGDEGKRFAFAVTGRSLSLESLGEDFMAISDRYELLLDGAAIAVEAATPPSSWVIQVTQVDYFFSSYSGTNPAHGQATADLSGGILNEQSYANDIYENLLFSNGSNGGPDCFDIKQVDLGYNADFIFFKMTVNDIINKGYYYYELEVDGGSESRPDYWVQYLHNEDSSLTQAGWTNDQSRFTLYRDANNDVGGSTPLTSNFSSGTKGDGYESSVSINSQDTWYRVNGGQLEIAISRSTLGLTSSTASAGVRAWASQSSSLDKSKFLWHDQNAAADLTGASFDNTNTADTSTWTRVGPGAGGTPPIVNSITVNEASTFAVFQVKGIGSGQTINLKLDASGSGVGFATLTGAGADLSGNIIQYSENGGATWFDASGIGTDSSGAQFTATQSFDSSGSTALLVRVRIINDTPFENAETFLLKVTNPGGTTTGVGTILDDGTGNLYDASGNINLQAVKDDDRILSISGNIYNEASPFILWSISGSAGQSVRYVDLSGNSSGADVSADLSGALQYLDPSGVWRTFDASNNAVLDGSGVTLIRRGIFNDGVFEGKEDFRLLVRNLGGTDASGTGISSIRDDGAGQKLEFNPETNQPIVTDGPGADFDDDRAIVVTGLKDVSEGSNAIFTVDLSGNALVDPSSNGNPRDTQILLQLTPGTADTSDYMADFTTAYYYDPSSNKVALDISGGTVTLPQGIATFYVKVPTRDDLEFEGAEDFSLKATIIGGNEDSDTSIILDDGTGKIYNDRLVPDPSGVGNDDRKDVSASGGTYNENSPWAIFAVTGVPAPDESATGRGYQLSVTDDTTDTLVNESTTPATLPRIIYSLDGGATWLTYAPGSTIVSPGADQVIYVAVDITAERDSEYEISERFKLTAIDSADNDTATAFSLILDAGNGDYLAVDSSGNPRIDASGSLILNLQVLNDDDRPLTVSGAVYNEEADYIFWTVAGVSGQIIKFVGLNGDPSGSALPGTDLSGNLQFRDASGLWQIFDASNNAIISDESGALLIRKAVVNDTTFEGLENFRLVVANTGGTDASGVSSLIDDGTGLVPALSLDGSPTGVDASGVPLPDTDAAKDDDRILSVAGTLYNEGSDYIFWTVKGNAGQSVRYLSLSGDPSGAQPFDPSGDLTGPLQYRDASGTWQIFDGSSNALISDPSGTLLIRKAVVNDAPYEGEEDFILSVSYASGAAKDASGVSSLIDDGTGLLPDLDASGSPIGFDASGFPVSDGEGIKDNDLSLSVTGAAYNEAAPFIFWKVSGSPGQPVQFVGLSGDPSGAAVPALDLSGNLQYRDPSGIWQTFDASSTPILDGSGSLLVRRAVVNDGNPEGLENFTLSVRNTGGTIASDVSSLDDRGTGLIPVLDQSGNPTLDESGVPIDASGVVRDDDRVLTVTGGEFNEGSTFMQWTVSGAGGQRVLFGAAPTGLDGLNPLVGPSGDITGVLEYNNGSGWLPFDGSSNAVLDSSGNLQVRTRVNNDTTPEGVERFILNVRNTGGTDASGVSSLRDDGSGNVIDASGVLNPPGVVRDDDRELRVSGSAYNEAAPYIFWNVTGSPSQVVRFIDLIGDSSGADVTSDLSGNLQYRDLSGNWQTFNPSSAGVLDASGSMLVRRAVVNDTNLEGLEPFRLVVQNTGGTDASGVSSLDDRGTGLIPALDSSGNPTLDASGVPIDASGVLKDDDRVVTVTGGVFNEGSSWALFTVSGGANQFVSLDLSGNTATEWDGSGSLGPSGDPLGLKDFGPTLQYLDASANWTTYISGNVALDPSGILRVRVAINQDPILETIGSTASGESFALIATTTSNKTGSDLAFILDNGQGAFIDASGNLIEDPSPEELDNDQPTLSVSGPLLPASEGSPLLFTITLSSALAVPTPLQLQLDDLSTEPNDYEPDLNNSTFNQAFYLDASGVEISLSIDPSGVLSVPAGVSQIYLRVRSKDDNVYEGLEELSLAASLPQFEGVEASASAGIIDDGTGIVYDGKIDASGNLSVDSSGTPDNDIPELTITTLTPTISEGSSGVFSVQLTNPLENPAPLTLTLVPGPDTPQASSGEFFFPQTLQVSWFDASGTLTTTTFTPSGESGTFDYPAGITEVFVRVLTSQDIVLEGSEAFSLEASLVLGEVKPLGSVLGPALLEPWPAQLVIDGSDSAFIVDDGTGTPFSGIIDESGNPQVSGTADNDNPLLTVTSLTPEISEGSKGLFRIELSNPLAFTALLNLGLRNGTAETGDYGFADADQVFYLDGSGIRQFLNLDASGNVTVPAGVTRLYALVETTQDNVYESDESFILDARLDLPGGVTDPTGSASALISDDGSAPVYALDPSGSGIPVLDGSGNTVVDPSGVPDDDRPKSLLITAPNDVSEGSPVVFKVTLDKVSELTLPVALSLGDISTELGDIARPVQTGDVFYRDASGNQINLVRDGSGNFLIPGGVKDFYVVVDSIDDDEYEGLEQFTLTGTLQGIPGVSPTGTGTGGIVDDGSGKPYTDQIDGSGNPIVDPSGVSDDDRGELIVTTLTLDVSEGSTALFSVTLTNALEAATPLQLTLSDLSATEPVDYRFPAAPQVYYLDASGVVQFLTLDGDQVTVPSGIQKLYVKVQTVQDSVFERSESFRLGASLTLTEKVLSDSDDANILDDGTGKVYTGALDGSGNAAVDPSGVPDNDAPRLTVTSLTPEISEGSKGLFRIDLSNALSFTAPLNLGLRNGSAESNDYSFPGINQVFYLDASGARQILTLDGSGNITVPEGVTRLYALVNTTADDVYEGDESFFLDARLDLPGGVTDPTGSASAIISDDGSAPVYALDPSGSGIPVLDGSGNTVVDPSGVPDDDRPKSLLITAPNDVSEGSPVVFKVTLDKVSELTLPVALSLGDISTEPGDYRKPVEQGDVFYRDASGNQINLVRDGSGNFLIPGGVKDFYVVVDSIDDDEYEGLEQFRLTGVLVSVPGASGSGTAGVIDDGTGTVYTGELDASGNPAVDPSGVRDDDRGALIVTTLTPDVSEGSTALFRITLGNPLADPTPMQLQLNGITAEANDVAFDSQGLQVSYRDASGTLIALSLDASGKFIVPIGITSFLVKVNTTQDEVYEGPETFQLQAQLLGAGANPSSDADDANILDNGTGTPYTGLLDPSGNPAVGPGPADDDIPSFRVTSLTPAISEGESGLFRIELGNPIASVTPLQLGLRNGSAESDDYSSSPSQVFYLDPSGQRVFLAVDPSSGIVNLPPLVTTLYVVVDTTPDNVFEGPETFFLDARLDLPGTVADPSGSATSLIADDGSAPVYATDASGNLKLDTSDFPIVDLSGNPDDDRTLNILGTIYNEASPYLYWNVQGNAGQSISLVTLSGDPSGAEPAVDLSGNLQYRDASGNWQTLDASSNPVLDATGALLIRKAVVNDTRPEGLENFKLVLEYPSGPRASGVSSLIDNGTGVIPLVDGSGNPTLDASGTPQNDPTKLKDDDRVLSVTGTTYNEASPFVFWTVTGTKGQVVQFVGLEGDPSGADPVVDLSGNLQYLDASGLWQTFDASSNPVLDASGTLLIRKAVVNDDVLEGLERFSLVVENTGGTDASGVSALTDTGTGLIPVLNPSGTPVLDASGNLQDDPSKLKDDDSPDEDEDGVPGNIEVELANLVTGNALGDLNRDGIPDNKQPACAVLAWITVDKFEAALNSSLKEIEPIIALTAAVGTTGTAVDPALQFLDAAVLPPDSLIVGGSKPTGPFIDAPWDPITFAIKPLADGAALTDIDANPANGNQVRVVIDIARAGVRPGDFNGYQKYVSQATIDAANAAGQPLRDLDGNTINAPGWIDFFARLDASGNRISDGARFVVEDGFVKAFELVFTDNKFGDNSVLTNFIQDPNLPVKIATSQLVPTQDGKGLQVIGFPGEILWVDFSAVLADASLQNGFELVRIRGEESRNLAAIGATPDSGFFGDTRVELQVGDVIRFVQVSGDLGRNIEPDIEISGEDNCLMVRLDDDGGDGDQDDLVLKVRTSVKDPYPRSTQMAALQTSSEMAYLDLRWIGANGITLNVDVKTDAHDRNTIRLVRLDAGDLDANGIPRGTVGGVAPSAGAVFDQAVTSRLISYSFSQSGQQTVQAGSISFTASQAGVYAPVLVTEQGFIYTFGSSSSSDGRPHVKVLGANSFSFEDAPSDIADWDYNDATVSFKVADPTSPKLELKLTDDTHGLTVVGGTGPADGLWLDLRAIMADANDQNSFDLRKFDASGNLVGSLGTVGATGHGTFLGSKELFLAVGETLQFVQNTNNNGAPAGAVDLRITQIGERYRIALDDQGAGGDGDFNDLVVDVDRSPIEPCQDVVKLAGLQRTSSDGILDLSWIGDDGIILDMSILTDSGNSNTLKFVKLDVDASGGYSVDGVAAGNSDAFRNKLRDGDNLADFQVTAGGEGAVKTAVWQLDAAEKGIYAAVLFTPDGNVFTFGNTALDGAQHLKVLGDSSFAFEDVLANRGSDFDHNDFVVRITPI